MRFAEHLLRFIEYFVPDYMRNDREASDQARMFLISHSVGPIIGNSVPLALYLADPTPDYAIAVLCLAITSFWGFPFLLKAGLGYKPLVLVSVTILNFCIFWSCWFNGGIASPTLSWVLVIPLLSFFYIGGDASLRVPLLAIFAAFGFGFFVLYLKFQPNPNDIPAMSSKVLAFVSNIAALLYVALMAIYYSRVFDRSLELEREVRRRQVLSRELRSAVSQSNEANQAKSQFLARMSHELRTPLNAVIGYSEVLREDMEADGRTHMLPDVIRIHDAGRYLLRLINSILDISKIEAGRMQFDVKQHDVFDIVSSAANDLRGAIETNGNRLDINFEAQERLIETDRFKLVGVLRELLVNAGDHTRNGEVRVTISRETHQDRPFYRIAVADTGAGIAPSERAGLFELHGDSRDAAGSQYGGTGMSLIVSRMLIRAMGGTIEVESDLGKGSTFSVLVPVKWNKATPDRDKDLFALTTTSVERSDLGQSAAAIA
ncbi:MAG: HAMP domain-containing sensor histidine kinase [Pseudomonadota bacterium]|nr:HAMP domain-containing sensor histidine kinase [Pseudomonadota bacterium]